MDEEAPFVVEGTTFGAPKNEVRVESFFAFFGSFAAAVSSAFRLSVDMELRCRWDLIRRVKWEWTGRIFLPLIVRSTVKEVEASLAMCWLLQIYVLGGSEQ